ncbi:hypothetical protein HMPREF1985_01594, partial [Mitsuokella sp. oral taxon 131 str. W9106]
PLGWDSPNECLEKHLAQGNIGLTNLQTRYRGLRKNLLQFHLLVASANLVMCLRAGRQREFCMTMG